MSEWNHRPSQHIHAVPVHRVTRQVTTAQVVALLVLTAAIVGVIVWYVLQDKPATAVVDAHTIASAGVPTTRPGTAVPTTHKPAEKAPPVGVTMPTDGTYLVGKHIKPGTYVAAGADVGRCYWARLRDTSGEMRSIIAASYRTGRQIVTIRKGDFAFVTDGCGPWELMKP